MLRFALALALLTAFGAGQWTQTSFILPDSLSGVTLDAIVYNPGNNTVFAGGENGVVVFDGVTRRRIARIPVPATKLLYVPVENKMYALGEDRVSIIDAAGLRVVDSLPLTVTWDWSYHPGLNRIYCVGGDSVAVIDCTIDSVVKYIDLPARSTNICCAPPVNKVYCPMNENDDVAVIDCATDSVITTFYTGAGRYQTLYNPLSNRLYISETGDEDVTVVDCDRDSVIRWLGAGLRPGPMCLNTRENKLYVADEGEDWFTIIDCAGDSLLGWRFLGLVQGPMAYDSVDNLLYVTLAEAESLLVFDGSGDSTVAIFGVPGGAGQAILWEPRQNTLYAATSEDELCIVRGGTNELLADFDLWCPLSYPVLRTATGELYAYESNDGFDVIDIEQRTVTRRTGNLDGVWSSAYNRYTDRVYVGRLLGADDDLAVIRCAENDTVVTVDGVPSACELFAFDPARPRTWCAFFDVSPAYVVDAGADTLVRRLDVGHVCDIEFAPDLDRVFVAVRGVSQVYVFDAATAALVDSFPAAYPVQLCYLPGRQLLVVQEQIPQGLAVLDATSGEVLLRELVSSEHISGMVSSPNDGKVFITFHNRTSVTVLHLDSLHLTAFEHSVGPDWTALDTTRHRLYIGDAYPGNAIAVVDTRRDSVVGTVELDDVGDGLWDDARQCLLVSQPQLSRLALIRDTTLVSVREVPGVGIGRGRLATHVRGILRLPLQPIAARFTLFTPDGRRVLDLKPGENDVSRLAPGIYFVRTASGVERDASSVTKVVVTR